jgi:hypothetical protein
MKLHVRLWKACRNQEDYRSGRDTNNHRLPDCSCGCVYFRELVGSVGSDWGVCMSLSSPRS